MRGKFADEKLLQQVGDGAAGDTEAGVCGSEAPPIAVDSRVVEVR